MTAQPPAPDPIDVAAAFPTAPATTATHHADTDGSPTPRRSALVDSARAALPDRAPDAEVILSAEHLTATKEWTVSGAVRFRRRIVTSTRTVEVTVRREELEVQVRDVVERDGAWVGTDHRSPAVPPPAVVTGPAVFTLREEVPDVTVRVVPYERVVVAVDRVTEEVQLTEAARREEAMVSGDTGAAVPPRRT